MLLKGYHQFRDHFCGSSQHTVANVFGVSQIVIRRALNRFQTSGSANQRHGGGRQRATTPIQDRCLVVQARRHPFVNATTLRNELRNAVGVNISTQTVRNRLRQSGLRSRRGCIRIPLTRLHKQACLNWAQDHVNWTDNDWDPVLFTDESSTVLTLHIDVLECGEDVGSDLKMPTSPNMTAMVEHHGVGWYQRRWKNRHAHRDEKHDDRCTLQG